uniref:RNA polymerase II subunit 5-mediating protein n=1 Tax=Davidia involucrata TaxID=16924 RepID=A0A5B7CAU3_DAVIN
MEESVKGAVTPLSSIFPAEEAQKASKRVQDTIAERQKELDQLGEFIADNTNLVNLVQRLPDELHHDIMVPFGRAAFFPGRFIHTNEFLVLLGEGYYAERTSKQTTEILKRRGKILESQVESLKAVMQDLKAEASFFDVTAAEAAEGLVEIREDYIEETSAGSVSKADNMKVVVEDEEYAHMMSRIDELEKEELAAEIANESDEDEEYARLMSRMDELEKEELLAKSANECDENGQTEADVGHSVGQQTLDDRCKNSEGHHLSNPQKQSEDEHTSRDLRKVYFQQDFSDQINFEGLKLQRVSEDGSSHSKSLALNESSSEKALMLPEVKENVQAAPTSTNEVSVRTSEPGGDGRKAFTGSIVEHTPKIDENPREQITASSKSTSQTSKPVSRFKMQRR